MSKCDTISIRELSNKIIDYRGKTPKKAGSGVRLITAKVVKNGGIQDDRAEYIADDYFDVWMTRGLVEEGDVVLTTEAPLGEVAIIGKGKFALGQRIILIRTDKDVMLPKFLYFSLQSDYAQEELLKRATGTTVLGIKQKELLDALVPYFSLNEQKKIVNILWTYKVLIDNNNRRIAILEEMAQRLYREWFVHFRFPGHENVPMVESELGMIPEGWAVGRVGGICDKIFSGGTPTTTIDTYWNGEYSWLSSGETRNAFIMSTDKTITEKGVENSSTRFAKKKDVVIASAGQGKTRGQTSYLLINTYINQSVIALRGKPYFEEFLFFNIRDRYSELRNASDSSSIRGSITTVLMSSLETIIPSDNIVKMFSEKASLLVEQIGVLERKNATLRKTRDLLLPRLISGDIDVSKIDIPYEDVN